jgi:hypothetical protein
MANKNKKSSLKELLLENCNLVIIGLLIIMLFYYSRQPRNVIYRLGQLGGSIPQIA